MGKRFWSLVLSVALIGGVFSALPAKADGGSELKFFLHSTGCSAADVNFDYLSIVDSDDAVECNYTGAGIRNEIGGTTGTVGAGGSNAIAGRDVATRYWDATDGGAVTLDATRPVTGQIFTAGASCVVTGQPCSPAGASLGEVILDIELVGYVGDTETALGAQTATWQSTPGGPHVTDVKIQPDAALDGTRFDRIELRTWTHGKSAGHGVIKTNGDASSFISIPTAADGSVVGGPGKPAKPAKPAKPTTGKDCGNGKSKGEGNGPKKCPKPPKGPKGPKPAPACPPFAPAEKGAGASTSVVTDTATEEKPVVVELTAAPGGPREGPVDERSFVYQNLQVDSAAADAGVYVKLEFADRHDYDLYLLNPDGSTADSSGDFNAVANTAFSCGDGACESGSNYESVRGLRTADCGGYTVEIAGFATTGGTVTLSMWLGEATADPATGAEMSAADMFFGMAQMRNPMTAESSQASGTPAANKGCTKGKGKKKGCAKPPVACAPFTPGELGAGKPNVIVTDAATEAAPVEQKINLAPSLGDADLIGELPDEGPLAASYDTFNVQVDSVSPNMGLYALFEFPDRRDYDLELLHTDGSYAARSHDFNPVCGTPANCSNEGHGGEAGSDFEKLVGISTTDCGGWTIEGVNWLGEGGEMTVKLWLGEVVNEPLAPGEEPHA